MSVISKASFVQIPSGYGEDKLYSEVPNATNGDFTFTRASTGTRVNSDGYIEEVPWNLNTYSEDFTNVSYIKDSGITIGSTNNVSPIGNNTATQIDVTNSGRIYKNVTSAQYRTSFYLKAGTFAYFRFANSQIDLNLGTINSPYPSSIEDVGNGWYRISVSFIATIRPFQVQAYPDNTYTSHTQSGNYFIWGSMLNYGDTTKPYIKTTNRLDVPRLDYSGGASCPTLLLEPQRTNIATYSEDYTQSFYIKDSGITATSNQLTSPTGLTDATKISVTNNGRIYANHTTGTYSTSVFIKAGTFSNFKVQGQNVDLGVSPIVTGSLDSEDFGNGWYRLTGYYTGTRSFQIQAYPDNTYSSHTQSGDYYLFGTQIESGSFPTSYIPTSGTSVTRNNDRIPSQILATPLTTEGTIFIDFAKIIQGGGDYGFLNLSNQNSYKFYFYGGGIDVYNNAAFIVNRATLEPNNSKVAVSWNNTNVKVYINGNDRTKSGAVASLNNTEKISFNDTLDICNMKAIILFSEQLTDTELITLTT